VKRIHLVQIGVGLIGGTTLAQVRETRERWLDRFGIDIVISALAGSGGAVVSGNPNGFGEDELASFLDARRQGSSFSAVASNGGHQLHDLSEAVTEVASLGRFIVADSATGSATAPAAARALELGGGAVYSNKAPLSLPLSDPAATAIWSAAGSGGRIRYETSCGAGLPVISTLQSLLDTGDEVIEIAGTVSGTFGAIFSDVAAGKPFSAAVRSAMERGYTEPDPRDDLSGLDVARKALILARTIGREIDLADISVESLVPPALQSVSVEEYLERVDEQDAEIAEMASAATAVSKTLKYVAQVRPEGKISVGLQPVPTNTVLGALQGPENIISFRTARYDDYPMNITGPGAGAAVTAAGVVADILALANGPIGSHS
jgi:homoserine dehydrogenase